MKEIFGWVHWFKELARNIEEGGETYLAKAARKVAWRNDGKVQPLLRYGDKNIDPFSFFYTLAQRSQDSGSRERVFPSINKAFDMKKPAPVEFDESEDAFIFPMPSYNASVLFHDGSQGNPKLLWHLFRAAVRGLDSVDPEDFAGALDIGFVGRVKLTQGLFLINPSQFIACDWKMDPIVELPTGELNWQDYKEWLQKVRRRFPGCEPYEVNFLAYQVWSKRLHVRSDRCFQVSTNVYNEGDDYWSDFSDNNWVYTGGPGSTRVRYPLTEPKRGDIVLTRFGRHEGRGIGIVHRNDYEEKFSERARLHVLWLNKSAARLAAMTSITGFSAAGANTVEAFRRAKKFAPTFELLERLAETPDIPHSVEPHPFNQILYGPPGTGKTYHAVDRALAIIDGVKVRKRREGDNKRFYEFRDLGQVAMVTFHQNYAYEDFIEGIRPELSDEVSGQVGYVLQSGIFKQMVKAANADKDNRFVLIIDEINRGNIAKIFGELITLIEDSRRLGAEDETRVTLPYSKEQFGVPNNLYLIGTMNTADRSIQLLDTALRRRFDFVEMMPEPEHKAISTDVKGVNCRKMLKVMNDRIAALLDREHQIGHTYLMGLDTMEKLSDSFQDKIFPLLQEYFFDDWSKIRAVLGRNGFVSEKKPPNSLTDREQADEERKIYERLPRGHSKWRAPEEYQKIYAVGSSDD